MLVITRKPNAKLQIGDNITVHLVNIQEGSVFLNILFSGGEVKYEVIGQDEEIEVTDEVKVRAALIEENRKVRLGITAPRDIRVRRIEE